MDLEIASQAKVAPFDVDVTAFLPRQIVTNLRLESSRSMAHSFNDSCSLGSRGWFRIDKNLLLGQGSQQTMWLYVEVARQEELAAEDLVVTDIRVSDVLSDLGEAWKACNGGLWVKRSTFHGYNDQVVTALDILFGEDAVDPRPQWTLSPTPLPLGNSNSPASRLTMLRGRSRATLNAVTELRVMENGKFKIAHISDLHLTTGVGLCSDAIDAEGKHLPTVKADQLTVDFLGEILDAERPNLGVLGGDQLHHDILDSQTAIFKAAAPFIARGIPYVFIFGNHDDEGIHALSRKKQMSIFETLPYCMSTSGPEDIDGVGNFFVHILAPSPSNFPVSTLYFFDSHGNMPSSLWNSYDCIKETQIKWFQGNSRANRLAREQEVQNTISHVPLAFLHIPIPEFGDDRRLLLRSGVRREPTEGPRRNSGLYQALVEERVAALGCGHDHGNDFIAQFRQVSSNAGVASRRNLHLCHSGAAGYNGYGSYGGKRFQRRARLFELEPDAGRLTTWIRVRFQASPIEKHILVDGGEIVEHSTSKASR